MIFLKKSEFKYLVSTCGIYQPNKIKSECVVRTQYPHQIAI